MIELSEAAGAEPVLLGMRIPPNYGQAYTRLFEQAFKKVAGETGLPVPFLLDGVVEAGQLQRDGIHPTAEAQLGLLENAWPAISRRCRTTATCKGRAPWNSPSRTGISSTSGLARAAA